MGDLDILLHLGLALAIGLLLGLERGWHDRNAGEGARIAGIRTFALTGLFGGVNGWLANAALPILPAIGLLALGALLAVSYRAQLRRNSDLGLTTEIALMLTFVLGVATTLAQDAAGPVAAVAVAATVLLSMKPALHDLIARIEKLELDALVKLALISVVILPLLPNRGYGPGAVLNPYEIWWAVVIVAGLSFGGYVAIRRFGARAGIMATGLFGGLASSTSTTLAIARLVRGQGALVALAAAGIVLSGSVTFLRILALSAVFAPALVAGLAAPMGAMAATGLFASALLYRGASAGAGDPHPVTSIANPLALSTALGFGCVLALVLLAVHYLGGAYGTGGVLAVAALSGLTDVDALTISVARLTGGDLPLQAGALAIFVAAAVNTAVKAGIVFAVGGRGLGRPVAVAYLAVIVAGSGALAAGWWLAV